MHATAELIFALALILSIGGLSAIILKIFRIPNIAGYLLAGVFVQGVSGILGYNLPLANLEVWRELGIVFLLFNTGLEFKIKDVIRLGPTPLFTGIAEVATVFIGTALLAKTFGHTSAEAILWGCCFSISSTSVAIRSLDEFQFRSRGFAKFSLGILLVEDLIAILFLVMLPALIAVQTDLVDTSIKTLWALITGTAIFLGGLFVMPSLIQLLSPYSNRELRLVFSIGLCLVMVSISTTLGLSAALGAFMAGTLLSDTKESRKIIESFVSIRQLFTGIFFVSIGLLFDWKFVFNHAGPIAAFSILIIFLKISSVSFFGILFGRSPRHSFQSGILVSHTGEFSFLIASLVVQEQPELQSLILYCVSISVITSILSPLIIQKMDLLLTVGAKLVPPSYKHRLANYQASIQLNSNINQSEFGKAIRLSVFRLLLNSIVILSISEVTMSLFKTEFFKEKFFDWKTYPYLALIATLLLSFPFYWALLFGRRQTQIWSKYPGLRLGLITFRAIVIFFLVTYTIEKFTHDYWALSFLVVSAILVGTFFISRRAAKFYLFIENTVLSNFAGHDSKTPIRKVIPWDLNVIHLTLSPYSSLSGITLSQANIKKEFDLTVLQIIRAGRLIFPPRSNELLLPLDEIYLLGSDAQIDAIRPIIETHESNQKDLDTDLQVQFIPKLLEDKHDWIGKTVQEVSSSSLNQIFIMGIDRDQNRISTPSANFIFQKEDLVWILNKLEA